MFWLILVIIVASLFIIRAINGRSLHRPLPIQKRIELLKELIEKRQDYLGREYKQELEEEKKLRYEKAKNPIGTVYIPWDEDTKKYFQDRHNDLLKYVQLNAILCERLRNDEQQLFEQVYDWASYLEKLMDISIIHTGNKLYTDAGLDVPMDELRDAERRGLMQEIYERIMARAKTHGVLTKNLTPSVL
jgi:hypothetical protein